MIVLEPASEPHGSAAVPLREDHEAQLSFTARRSLTSAVAYLGTRRTICVRHLVVADWQPPLFGSRWPSQGTTGPETRTGLNDTSPYG